MSKAELREKIKQLKAELKACKRVRDLWCEEYTLLRNQLAGAGAATPSTESLRR